MLFDKPSIRILHVVGGMNRGGIETWLMHVLRNIDRDRFQMDFLVHTTEPCAYDEEVRALGSRIIPCLDPFQPRLYDRNFQRLVREYGPYDIVHSHVHNFSGYVLRLAKQAGVPIRIAHSHNDTSSLETKAGLSRRLYIALTKWWIARYKTIGLAASRLAAVSLFGSDWARDPRCQILYCGVDLAPFRDGVDRFYIRSELGIPADAFVIGHVGRFEEQKNHLFLLEIAASIAQKQPNLRLLLAGDGSLRPQIQQKAIEMGLDKYVIFAGLRSDVPRLMLGAMDTFVLPSLYEGLGLVLIEAQAAGLPCVFSDVVPEEADVIKPLVQRLSLSQSPSTWAETILAAPDTTSGFNQTDALASVENSPFNIAIGLKKLAEVYEANFSATSR
ncbi:MULTISPECIES: glycosyltransferase family 1 protein [unclassified Microcoleus]|uniref:glycosyltransferase family 1 protein n=1 Tax=unclassified Microcoleus TaxID=2642155 RepID=UPI002FD4D988